MITTPDVLVSINDGFEGTETAREDDYHGLSERNEYGLGEACQVVELIFLGRIMYG